MPNEEEEIDPRYPTGYSPERLPIVRARLADRAKAFQEMLAAAKFKWVNPLFTPERFPARRELYRADALEMLTLERDEKPTGILKAFGKRSLQPACFEQLLASAAASRKWFERVAAVVALGTLHVDVDGDGETVAPCIAMADGKLRLTLVPFDPDAKWDRTRYVFLGAPKR